MSLRRRIAWRRRWLRGQRDFWVYVVGSEAKYIIGTAAFIAGFVVTWTSPAVGAVLTVLGIVISIVTFIQDSREFHDRWRQVVVDNPAHRNSHPFRPPPFSSAPVVAFPQELSGYGGEQVWTDPQINMRLAEEASRIRVHAERRRSHWYSLPPDLQSIAARALLRGSSRRSNNEQRRARPLWFNGRLARIDSEPAGPDGLRDTVTMSRTTYFDGQASNELWHWSADKPIDDGGRRLSGAYATDQYRRILTLEDAGMANIVGVTILAITSDDRLIFVRQSNRNSVSPGAFAASASGSLDWADVLAATAGDPGRDARLATLQRSGVPTDSLHAVVLYGMLRELEEESAVRPEEVDVDSLHVTSYFRWLSRGAKPEFSGIARLTCSSVELKERQLDAEESIVTSGHTYVSADVLREAAASIDPSRPWAPDLAALVTALNADQEENHSPLPESAELRPVYIEDDATLTELLEAQTDLTRSTGRASASTIATFVGAAAYLHTDPGYLDPIRSAGTTRDAT